MRAKNIMGYDQAKVAAHAQQKEKEELYTSRIGGQVTLSVDSRQQPQYRRKK
jgi:hypothetical protein